MDKVGVFYSEFLLYLILGQQGSMSWNHSVVQDSPKSSLLKNLTLEKLQNRMTKGHESKYKDQYKGKYFEALNESIQVRELKALLIEESWSNSIKFNISLILQILTAKLHFRYLFFTMGRSKSLKKTCVQGNKEPFVFWLSS